VDDELHIGLLLRPHLEHHGYRVSLARTLADAGLPVVGARVGGIPELVADGESGILVPPEDPRALAAALDSLARDRGRLAELGRRGRERVATHFSAEQVGRRTVALYRELCGSST